MLYIGIEFEEGNEGAINDRSGIREGKDPSINGLCSHLKDFNSVAPDFTIYKLVPIAVVSKESKTKIKRL